MLTKWYEKMIYANMRTQIFVVLCLVLLFLLVLHHTVSKQKAQVEALTRQEQLLQQQLASYFQHSGESRNQVQDLTEIMKLAKRFQCMMAVQKEILLFKCPLNQRRPFINTLLSGNVSPDLLTLTITKQKQFVNIDVGLNT